MEKLLCLKHGYQKISINNNCQKCYNEEKNKKRKELIQSITIICKKHGEQPIIGLNNLKCKKCYNEERNKNRKTYETKYINCIIHGRQKYNSRSHNKCHLCHILRKK